MVYLGSCRGFNNNCFYKDMITLILLWILNLLIWVIAGILYPFRNIFVYPSAILDGFTYIGHSFSSLNFFIDFYDLAQALIFLLTIFPFLFLIAFIFKLLLGGRSKI